MTKNLSKRRKAINLTFLNENLLQRERSNYRINLGREEIFIESIIKGKNLLLRVRKENLTLLEKKFLNSSMNNCSNSALEVEFLVLKSRDQPPSDSLCSAASVEMNHFLRIKFN